MIDLQGLPGAPRVRQGLADLAGGRWSQQALLLAIAAGRLRDLGLPVPEDLRPPEEPELALYDLLCAGTTRTTATTPYAASSTASSRRSSSG